MRLSAALFSSVLKNRYFYVTTPIFYANASPHLGHLYSAVIADAIQRFEKLLYPKCSVIFSTGTDEHGIKVQQAAAKQLKPVDEYCNAISNEYKTLFQDSGIDYTDYIRTTEKRHEKAVQHFWTELKKRDFVYLSQYSGWYCVNDETFLTESHIKEEERDGKKCMVSIESGHPVEWTEESNYMFRLSSLKSDIMHWLKKSHVITPKKYQDILCGLINNQYLPDISISRPINRVHWSIQVPDDPSQGIYVWLDALINYLTVIGYPDNDLTEKWPVDVHVVGKDILKFHGLYWPAFLMAIGLNPPRKILCHGHWTVDGKKMSKSLNNVVNPYNTCSSLEALRYFLLREGTMHSDANYSEIKMARILNSELADSLGNLLNRCTGPVLNPRQEFPPLHFDEFRDVKQKSAAIKLISLVDKLSDICQNHYENYNFFKVVDCVIATLHAANLFFESSKPWALKKLPEKQKELDVILHITLETLRISAIILIPIIPIMSNKILDKLLIPKHCRLWYHAGYISWNNDMITETHNISSDKILLFQKITLEKEKQENKS